jgi:purine-binding chemotaxis protein CheW
MQQFVTFRLNDLYYGIDILYVREINQAFDVTPVQHAPDYIRGLINLRGQVITIMDAGLRLGMTDRDTSETSHNIILKTDHELAPIRVAENRPDLNSSVDPAGLLIDDFGDVVEIPDEEIESAPANIQEGEADYLSGVFKSDGKLFSILNITKVVAA